MHCYIFKVIAGYESIWVKIMNLKTHDTSHIHDMAHTRRTYITCCTCVTLFTYLAHSTDVRDVIGILVLAVRMEHSPTVGACEHLAWTVTLEAVPVVTIILLTVE